MLRYRVITAVVLLAILAGALYVGDLPFCIVMAAGFAITFAEWLRIARVPTAAAAAVGVVAWAAMSGAAAAGSLLPPLAFRAFIIAVACLWLVLAACLFASRTRGFRIPLCLSHVLSILFVPAAFLSLAWFMGQGGWRMMLSVFMIVWLADICAYAVGCLVGRHKMAPAISPGKSWEGAAGAVAGVFLAALAAWCWLPHETVFTSLVFERAGFAAGFVVVLVIVVVSIAGDLFESAMKRMAGVKDSSKLLPGHGGFYDRLDSSLAVFPAAAAVLLLL